MQLHSVFSNAGRILSVASWALLLGGNWCLGLTCVKQSSCTCKYDDGGMIDLNPLAHTDMTPRFKDFQDSRKFDNFSWNPCRPFNEEGCANVAVCQLRKFNDDLLYFNVGVQDSAEFTTDMQGNLTLQYSVNSSGPNRLKTSFVKLICDRNTVAEFSVTGENPPNVAKYYMELRSTYACPSANASICYQKSACSCQYPDGRVIDLSPISKNDGTPEFFNLKTDTGSDEFSWNPCNDFTEESCKDVAVCQARPGIPVAVYYSLGDQKSATFHYDGLGNLQLKYTSDNPIQKQNIVRTTYITLTCDETVDKDITVPGETPPGSDNFYMELKSRYACPRQTPATPRTTTPEIPMIPMTNSKGRLDATYVILLRTWIGAGTFCCILFIVVVIWKCKRNGSEKKGSLNGIYRGEKKYYTRI